jgi:hypothetical protein
MPEATYIITKAQWAERDHSLVSFKMESKAYNPHIQSKKYQYLNLF